MSATAYGQIPVERDISEDVISSSEIAALEQKRVLFFAGDAITSKEKYEFPELKAAGGIFLPHLRTLPKTPGVPEAAGMIYKCKFTSMTAQHFPEWEVMLPPGERQHYPSSFVEKDGDEVREYAGFLGSDSQAVRRGEFKQMRQGDVRYKKWYPGSEVRRATQRSTPHGVGGVVEIAALAGASAREIKAAQLYFFPDWEDVRQGLKRLPETVREIEAHIRERISAITEQDWVADKKAQYTSIGNDMLRSCVEFRISGLEIVEQDDIIKEEASKKGHITPHSAISEHLLPQIEYKRRGDLLAGEASSTAELVREMKADRDAANRGRELEQENRAKELELRERELALREKELGLGAVAKKADSIESVVARSVDGQGEEVVGTDVVVDDASFPFPRTKEEKPKK